jgi:peptidoglycan/LPS O-acetylase OafA/YrhL
MGILLLFYFIVLFVIIGLSILQIFKLRKEINFNKTIFYSILVSILFLFITNLTYANSEEVYAFEPFFLIPFITIVIPFGLGAILNVFKKEKLKIISNSLIISILISIIVMIIFNEYLDVIERFNLKIYY